VKWYRLAADQGYANAQDNLGVMYDHGRGVTSNRVIAYALFSLSASKALSNSSNAARNRSILELSMSPKEINVAQDLMRELEKPGNLLKVVDKYARNPLVKESPKLAVTPPPAGDGYPARPEKRPGVVSCNTSCINADCRRTYDDGRKVRFTAQRKFDPFSGEWKIDAGGC